MAIRRDIITNPYLNEYVYDLVINMPVEERRKLNLRYLKAIKNSKTAKTFVTKSTIEEKIILLTKLGVDFGFFFNLSKQKLNALIEKYGKNNKGLTDELVKQKVMVVTTKEEAQFLGLMASNIHSETWMMNREMYNLGYKFASFRKTYANPTNKAVKEAVDYSKEIAKMASDILINTELSADNFGLTKNDLHILLYLYVRNSYYVEEELIKNHFRNILTVDKIGKALYSLQKTGCIDKSADSSVRRRKYIVTSIGKETVIKFQRRLIELSNFT